jgi:hypothetical protein
MDGRPSLRIESVVTSISWTPAEFATSLPVLPFGLRAPRYHDVPPPQQLDDLDSLREEPAFCGANVLEAWIEVESGRIVDSGYGEGGGSVGVTRFDPGESTVAAPAMSLQDLRETPQGTDDSVRFVQTAGGYAGFPVLRRGGRKLLRVVSPLFWTTLALTLRADGSAEHELVGASRFPRHWIYDATGDLVEKTAEVDRTAAERDSATERTPWGDENSPTLVTEAESSIERALAAEVSAAEWTPRPRKLAAGEELVHQGEAVGEIEPLVYLILDGALAVDVDGETVAEVGAGAVVGERALFERGARTATLRAVTPCKILPVPARELSPATLSELSDTHRRES